MALNPAPAEQARQRSPVGLAGLRRPRCEDRAALPPLAPAGEAPHTMAALPPTCVPHAVAGDLLACTCRIFERGRRRCLANPSRKYNYVDRASDYRIARCGHAGRGPHQEQAASGICDAITTTCEDALCSQVHGLSQPKNMRCVNDGRLAEIATSRDAVRHNWSGFGSWSAEVGGCGGLN